MKKILFSLLLLISSGAAITASAGTSTEEFDFKKVDSEALSGGKSADEAAKEGANGLGNTVGAPLAQ